VPIYFEAAVVITVLVLLGQVLELRARAQTSGAIKALLNLAPKTARRVRSDGADEEVALELVQVGDRLRVRPGEKVPVDGEMLDGRVSIDESMVTGESMPVTKVAGDKVIGGALNKTGSFLMRADRVSTSRQRSAAATARRPFSWAWTARSRRFSPLPTRSRPRHRQRFPPSRRRVCGW
jgi:Cu+-exporting ATPase